MLSLHPQFVVDNDRRPQAVLLPVAEWEQVVEELDELDDIRAYDEAKRGPQDAVDFPQVVRELNEGRDG